MKATPSNVTMRNFLESNNSRLPPLRQCGHLKGSLDKPITLITYGDYQCPSSAQANATANDIYQRYHDQLCLIYRHCPRTPPSTSAWKAAEAAEAASDQGKFWEMHNILYQHFQALEDGNLVEYADQLDLDIPQFLNRLANHTYAQNIREDLESGMANGVAQTPTFFIHIRCHQAQKLASLMHNILEITLSPNRSSNT